ncbi:MAG: hypothetical protein OSB62_04300 [Alphaproteobacteria bacterium]|nr:hypothetical protein [Alphaproteobacteria bacterium]
MNVIPQDTLNFDELLANFYSDRAIAFRPVETMMQIHPYPGDGGYAMISIKNFRYLSNNVTQKLKSYDVDIQEEDDNGVIRLTGRKDLIMRILFGDDHRIQAVPKSVFHYVDRAFGADLPVSRALYFDKRTTVQVPALDDTLKDIQIQPQTLVMYEAGLLHFIHFESEFVIKRLSIMTLTRDMARALIGKGVSLQEALQEHPSAAIEKDDVYVSGAIYNESIPCDKKGKPLIAPDPFTHGCRSLEKVEDLLLSTERNIYNSDAVKTHLGIVRYMRDLNTRKEESQLPFMNMTADKVLAS